MHVERNLALELLDLKLNGLFLKLHQTLGQKLTVSLMLADINKTLVSFFNLTATEESEANLSNCSVVDNLVINSLKTNNFGDMGLQKQILSLDNSVVESMVVDLAESSAYLDGRSTLLVNKVDKARDFLFGIVKEVSILQLIWLVSKSCFDILVQAIILIVDVVNFSHCNTRKQIRVGEAFHKADCLISNEKHQVFILNQVQIVKTGRLDTLECSLLMIL